MVVEVVVAGVVTGVQRWRAIWKEKVGQGFVEADIVEADWGEQDWVEMDGVETGEVEQDVD